VAAPTVLAQVDPHAQASHWSVSPLNLHVACQWIEDGTAARRLAWQRKETSERWRLTRRLLGARLQNTAQPSPHAWLATPHGAEKVVRQCREQGVEVVPASVFAIGASQVQAVRISLSAAASRAQLKRGLEVVHQVLLEQ